MQTSKQKTWFVSMAISYVPSDVVVPNETIVDNITMVNRLVLQKANQEVLNSLIS